MSPLYILMCRFEEAATAKSIKRVGGGALVTEWELVFASY
jgi:hypothetical protein